MKIHNIYLKTLGLFFIFYTGVTGENNSNVCRQIKDNKYIPFKKRIIHYGCKNRGTRRIRRFHNPYAVIAKDMMRRYVYVINIVIYSLFYLYILWMLS